jgi:hypothetical protein
MMAQENRISASIAEADKTAITTHIAGIKTKLIGVLLFNLSADERQALPKMGDKSLSFTGKAFEYAKQNPALVPSFLDIIEADKDYVLANDLFKIYQELLTLVVSIEDAIMVSGSEAYDAAKIFYAAVKGAARSNVAGANAIADDLKTRYPGKIGGKAKTDTTEPK